MVLKRATTDNFQDYYGKEPYFFYKHDQILYRSTVRCNRYTYQQQQVNCLTIILSNDCFLHPATYELTTLRQNIHRHDPTPHWDGSPEWVLLDSVQVYFFVCFVCNSNRVFQINSAFADHIKFARQYFKLRHGPLKCKVYYNWLTDRIDFKAFSDNDELNILYEPGYPVSNFDDEWLEIPEDC